MKQSDAASAGVLQDSVPIALLVGGLALLPLLQLPNTAVNFLVTTLIITLTAQGWNILAGYAGQYSFGHAAFFGTAAYVTAVLQTRYGVNAWGAFVVAIASAALVGFVIGALVFRAGLAGSYFALVTLAFAEVFRILANAWSVTGGAAGLLVKLQVDASNFQFKSRIAFYYVALGLVAAVMVLTHVLERRRLGARMIAVRENEAAAQALGVDALATKLCAITLSAGITGAAGALYLQYFLFVDATIAFGAHVSVEALVAPIVGGLGTVFGPVIGALTLHGIGELTKLYAGRIPGIDLVIFGLILVLAVAFAPQGLVGLARRWLGAAGMRRNSSSRAVSAASSTLSPSPHVRGELHLDMPLLRAQAVTKRFGGLTAVADVSLAVMPGSITGLIGPNGAGKTTLFAVISGFDAPTAGRVLFEGHDVTGLATHRRAGLGIARTFQIVQPFAGLTVAENIAVGAYLREPRGEAARTVAHGVAAFVGLAAEFDKPAGRLTVAGRKRLELARALATRPKLLLLDEVLAGLNPSEIRDMIPVIRAIRDQGVTILMIEHVMQAVMSLCDPIHVLAQGRMIATGNPGEIAANPAVVEAYLGDGAAKRLAGGGDG